MDVAFSFLGDKASAITLLQQLVEGLPEHSPSRISISLVPANGSANTTKSNGVEDTATTPTSPTIFNRVRYAELLEECGLSQQEFATLLREKGYHSASQSRISAWKTGRMTPDIARISIIAECLGVPLTEITT